MSRRQRLLDAPTWLSAVGVLAFVGALWGPAELRDGLAVLVVAAAAAAVLHAVARPGLLRWANPGRPVELPGEAQVLLAGSPVSSVAVATGTVSQGGEESDDVRLRIGSRVLLAPCLADVGPRRLAALALTAPQADRGAVAPAVLSSLAAVLALRHEAPFAAAAAVGVAVAFLVLGVWHHRRGRLPDDAIMERVGADAVMFAFLAQGWATAARSARSDAQHAEDLWRQWVEAARDSAANTEGLRPSDVDAELARLPRLDY